MYLSVIYFASATVLFALKANQQTFRCKYSGHCFFIFLSVFYFFCNFIFLKSVGNLTSDRLFLCPSKFPEVKTLLSYFAKFLLLVYALIQHMVGNFTIVLANEIQITATNHESLSDNGTAIYSQRGYAFCSQHQSTAQAFISIGIYNFPFH